MQRDAYTAFAGMMRRHGSANSKGCRQRLSRFPIVSHNGFVEMKFVEYNLAKPGFDVRECQNAGPDLRLGSPCCKVQFIIYDRESSTAQSKVVKRGQGAEVYMGEVP